MPDRLELADGERLHYRGDLRPTGEIAVTEDRLLIRESEQVTSVPYENVDEITYEDYDWFLVVLSLGLVGFGVYSTGKNVLAGAVFALAGIASLTLTYRRRDRVRVHTHSQAKPISVHPADVDELFGAAETALDAARASIEAESTE